MTKDDFINVSFWKSIWGSKFATQKLELLLFIIFGQFVKLVEMLYIAKTDQNVNIA